MPKRLFLFEFKGNAVSCTFNLNQEMDDKETENKNLWSIIVDTFKTRLSGVDLLNVMIRLKDPKQISKYNENFDENELNASNIGKYLMVMNQFNEIETLHFIVELKQEVMRRCFSDCVSFFQLFFHPALF